MTITNIPQVKCGIISVSRDCFIISLSENRRRAITEAYGKKYGSLYEVQQTVENEKDMLAAVEEAKRPAAMRWLYSSATLVRKHPRP